MPTAPPDGRSDGPSSLPNAMAAGLRTTGAAGVSQARRAFEIDPREVPTAIGRFTGWIRSFGPGGVSGGSHSSGDPARPAATIAPALRSIGEAVRLAIAPGEIDAAYRVIDVSRGRDGELWVVESRFGPR